MSIDWITVIAQLANFLLLVWLLKRFLYRPILEGIDAREAEIAARLAAAKEAKESADDEKQRYQQQYAKHLADRDDLLEAAMDATANEREQMLQAGRERLEQEQKNWQQFFEQERSEFQMKLEYSGAETLYELVRKALMDLADEQLENAIARHLMRRLESMRTDIEAAAGDASTRQVVSVTSHAPLSENTQAYLQQQLQEHFPDITVNFHIDAEQAVGVVLQVAGARLVWTLDTYIDELQRQFAQQYKADATAGSLL